MIPFLAVLVALLTGCAAHRSGDAVKSIVFTVEGRPFPSSVWVPQSNAALRGEMAQRVSSWQSLVFPGAIEPEWLDRTRLEKDGQRIELWLAEHGYFDARFLRWEVTPHGRKSRKLHPVSVRGYIEQGPPSRIRALKVEGLEGLDPDVERRIRGSTTLVEGRVYAVDDQTATVAAIRTAMLEGGYAYVDVTGSAEAYPEARAVDVTIVVKPGPPSHFGPVDISGVGDVPDGVVADAVTFKEGDPFDPRELQDTRSALFALRVYSVVNVVPALDDPEAGVVPVSIQVKGTKWHRIKAGPGVQIESGKGTAYVAGEWSDTNLFHRLWYLKQTTKLGAAGVVTQDLAFSSFSFSQVTVAPVVDVTTDLSIPHAMGPRWSLDVSGRVQAGIETGYRFFSPELNPGVTWHPVTRNGRDLLSIGLGYRIRYFDYFAFTVDVADIIGSPLGLDLTDPYLLSMLDQHLTWDARDDPTSPTGGWYGTLTLAEAGGPVLGNFNFVRAQTELRGYWSVPLVHQWNPLTVVAARVGTGVIVPYGSGDKASVPYAERLYLGGGTTVRGWGAGRLGPSVATTDTSTGETVLVPAGGLLEAFGNLELRKVVGGGISVAGFTDVGRVWASPSDFSLDGLQVSVGGGLRYATVVGPIRGDVGVRLSPDSPDLPSEPRWTVHFGLAEAF